MSYLFQYFPKVDYDLRKNGKTAVLTDITKRFKITQVLENRTVVYYDYQIKDGERPDIIAQLYYKDPSLSWLVLYANDIIDPYYDWPLDSTSFDNYIVSKYGSVSSAMNTVHHYEQIISAATTYNDSLTGIQKVIPERKVEVTQATYNTLTASDRRVVYQYDYELEKNDNKRNIKLIEKDYLTNILGELRNVLQ